MRIEWIGAHYPDEFFVNSVLKLHAYDTAEMLENLQFIGYNLIKIQKNQHSQEVKMQVRSSNFSIQTPEKQIDGIFAEVLMRDKSYKMPKNHYHPYFELYYLESGRCRFFIGNRMLDVQAGDLLMIPPQTFHYTRYLYGSCKRCNLFFRREDIDQAVIDTFPGGRKFLRQWHVLQIPEFYRDALSQFFVRLLSEMQIDDSRTPMLLRYRLQEMLLVAGRVGHLADSMPEDIHTTDQAIVRAAEFMRANLSEELDAEKIAGAAGFSPNYLSRKFRQATGMGVHEYLTFLRLQQAAVALAETKDSVTDIALSCGFSDSNYFKDCFKRRYGVSPRAYRTRAQGR